MENQRITQLELLVEQLNSKLNALSAIAGEHVASIGDRVLQSSAINDGDTAWVITASALVLMMTLPGLALYYSGMVRTKNVLATVMQTFTIACVITVEWLMFGYSLSFAPVSASSNFQDGREDHDVYPVYGGGSRCWLQGLSIDSVHQLAPTIPESVFCVFQMTFAIITAALIAGSFADRMKFGPMILFIFLWHVVVYCPTAHSIWHPTGFLYRAGVLDFAGGNVVHICSGVSGLMSAIVLGHRKGFGKERFQPHNILFTFLGMALLWVGWFGFNAGSAYHADGRAGFAMLVTQIASATASLSWMGFEWGIRGQPSVLGMVSGAVSGLVAITPASGYVDYTGAFIIGLLAGPVCYIGAQVKHYLGYDDALDAFGVHAVGGILGGIMTGFFASPEIDGGVPGVYYAQPKRGGHRLAMQLYAIIVTIGWAAFATYLLLKALDLTIGLRVSAAEEEAGLDSSLHGETLDGNQKTAKGEFELVPTKKGEESI